MSQTQPSTKPRRFKKANKPLTLKGSKIMAKKRQAQLLVEQKAQKKEVEEKKKESKKKREFPKIPRIIPELPSFSFLQSRAVFKISLKWEIVAVLIILGLLLNWLVIKHLFEVGKDWVVLFSQRQQLSQQIGLWENITKQYPNYRDAYFEGAVLAYRLGNRQKENQFLTQLQLIDPNFPLTQGLEKLRNVE